MSRTPILIAGGGIGGLCAALALRQNQQAEEIQIYEQATALGRVGAGLTLWPNAMHVLDKLGVGQAVRQRGHKIMGGEVRDDHGRVLNQSNLRPIEQKLHLPTIAIHRADLHDILWSKLQKVGGVSLHLGQQVTKYSEETNSHVMVHLADGSTAVGAYLIGADGIHSAVRQQMKPTIPLRYSGYTAYRGLVQAASPSITQDISFEAWGQGQRFGLIRINKRQLYWFATHNSPPAVQREPFSNKKHLQNLFAEWFHPVPWLIDETPAEEILHNDIYDFVPQKGWHHGRVVLLGDAIHPTTPNMGQGACMAIESTAVLADNWPDFATYEAQRAPRTAGVTTQSWRIGRMGQWENPLLCRLRNTVSRITPARTLERSLLNLLRTE